METSKNPMQSRNKHNQIQFYHHCGCWQGPFEAGCDARSWFPETANCTACTQNYECDMYPFTTVTVCCVSCAVVMDGNLSFFSLFLFLPLSFLSIWHRCVLDLDCAWCSLYGGFCQSKNSGRVECDATHKVGMVGRGGGIFGHYCSYFHHLNCYRQTSNTREIKW